MVPILIDLDSRIQTLAQWMFEAERIVVFTGAGISTESGLPDFRVIIINQGETPFDRVAHLRFHETAGKVLPKAVQKFKERLEINP